MSAPTSIDTRLAQALALRDAGRTGESLSLCLKLAQEAPADPRPLRLAGHLLFAAGRHDQACVAFETALVRQPGPALRGELGAALLAAGRAAEARPHLQQAAEARPRDASLRAHLALAQRALRDLPSALENLTAAATLAPGVALHHANLASTLESLGRNAEAARAAARALALEPAQPVARLVVAQLKRVGGDPTGALEQLDPLLAARLSSQERAWVQHERGQALDRLDRSAEAFTAFSEAQALASGLPTAQRVDRQHYPAMLNKLSSFYADSQPLLPGPADDERPRIAFLVGFPRSGTTLMEQVLSAHPGLVSVDEEELLTETLRAAPATLGRALAYPEGLESLSDAEFRALREDYRARLAASLGAEALSGAAVVLDKMPLNLPHLGLIRRLFPEAPVLAMLRDPRDCVLSTFMQSFVPTVAMVHFATLEGAAALYAQVMGIWLAARGWPGLRALEIHYEDVVADLEGQARLAVEHLGLPWDQAVLAYREGVGGRYISTPSRQDVARPIFTRARGRWRRYAAEIEGVQPALAPFVAAFGYDE